MISALMSCWKHQGMIRLSYLHQTGTLYQIQLEFSFCIRSVSWADDRSRYQAAWDRLTHESDEIESLLRHKFMMKGGGRLLLDGSTMNAVREANRIGKDEQYTANQRFGGDSNKNTANDEGNSDEDWSEATPVDEDIDSDMDSERDIDIGSDSEFERDQCHQNNEIKEGKGPNREDSIEQIRRFSAIRMSQPDRIDVEDVDPADGSTPDENQINQQIINHEEDDDVIFEPTVRRKKNKTASPKESVSTTPIQPQDSEDTTSVTTMHKEQESAVNISINDQSPPQETRTQKFKRLERNWSKDRRYTDPFKSGGVLSKLGQYYEQQQESRYVVVSFCIDQQSDFVAISIRYQYHINPYAQTSKAPKIAITIWSKKKETDSANNIQKKTVLL